MRIKNSLSKAIKKFNSFSIGARIVLIAFFLFYVLEAALLVIPFLSVLSNSVRTANEIIAAPMGFSSTPRLQNYLDIFTYPTGFYIKGTVGYLQLLFNSVWQTFGYLIVNLISSAFVAYALAKYKFPGRRLVYFILIFVKTIPIVGTGAASFKLINALNMHNNPALIWFTWGCGFDYSAFIMFGFFSGISTAYMEAARIDGASEWKIFTKVMLPQMLPCIVALMITNFVGRWNEYTEAQIYLNNYPNLAYGLFLFREKASYGDSTRLGVYYAALVLTALPSILLYSTLQNFVIKNMTVGGLKG